MGREFNRWMFALLATPMRALGFVVGSAFSLLYGPFYRRRIEERQKQLEHDVRERLSFLFVEHNAHTTPSTQAGNLEGLNASVVTIAVDGLFLRFIRWREVFQVHVASEGARNSWHELSLVLSLIDPAEQIRRGAIRDFDDVSSLLRSNIDRLTEAFSQKQYAQMEKQLSEAHTFDRVVNKQWETEINRRLYGNR